MSVFIDVPVKNYKKYSLFSLVRFITIQYLKHVRASVMREFLVAGLIRADDSSACVCKSRGGKEALTSCGCRINEHTEERDGAHRHEPSVL